MRSQAPRHRSLISQSHGKRNCYVEAGKILSTEDSNSIANALTADRNGLIGHYLRACPQSVSFIRVYGYAKVGCVDEIGGHQTNDH